MGKGKKKAKKSRSPTKSPSSSPPSKSPSSSPPSSSSPPLKENPVTVDLPMTTSNPASPTAKTPVDASKPASDADAQIADLVAQQTSSTASEDSKLETPSAHVIAPVADPDTTNKLEGSTKIVNLVTELVTPEIALADPELTTEAELAKGSLAIPTLPTENTTKTTIPTGETQTTEAEKQWAVVDSKPQANAEQETTSKLGTKSDFATGECSKDPPRQNTITKPRGTLNAEKDEKKTVEMKDEEKKQNVVYGKQQEQQIKKPVVCGIASLGYDHIEILGHTLAEISAEKAGIFKSGVPAFTMPQPDEAMSVLDEKASELERMSNGKYKNAEHRATMDKEKTRMSWPVFVESSLDHEFGPLPELITGDDNAPKFKPFVYKDYKVRKLKKLALD
ncbi:hypothetical protein F2Q69_00040113 [Brassica cretica]|uniref:Isopenicillin N synthase-like Fe(2+) 2OG dioxygenase domain-containing protein n=1 Tax=Brassica cretica TaxID=69181 RepID=A0A8S9N730_BRACR|nr:hypothetical protein F2Q69_00040113 [Brassica cretica]